ncbi:WGR domain-containing protein [Myxococcota bacterium]
MPRYEKSGRKYDHAFEIDDDRRFVYTAAAKRTHPDGEWIWKDKDLRFHSFDDQDAAQQFLKQSIDEITAKNYALVGNDIPIITLFRAKREADAKAWDVELQTFDQKTGVVSRINAGEVVHLVGTKVISRGSFWEIVVNDATMTTRSGPVGNKGDSDTEEFATRDRALRHAHTKAMLQWRLGYRLPDA